MNLLNNKKNLNIAIIGATGLVGQEIIKILQEQNFSITNLYLLASEKSKNETILFNNKPILVEDLAEFDFSNNKLDLAFFSAGSKISSKYAMIAAKAGAIVIDNTAYFRYQDDIPLIIPEVNPEDIVDYKKHNIISNPNCAAIQALIAIKPIYDLVGIKKINFVTYQSVSGTGKKALTELIKQTTQALSGQSINCQVYPKQIAFNILPHIDVFDEQGHSKEELKMARETHKILHDNTIKIMTTAARVPTLYGHAVAIHLEINKPLKADLAKKLLAQSPGINIIDDLKNNDYPTIIHDATNTDLVSIGRIRNFIDDEQGLAMWVVADNIRKGAALNAVQIANMLQ